jgi:hypothetical protein
VTSLEEQEARLSPNEGSSSGLQWEVYGDVLSMKGEDIFRLGAQNFGGMASKSKSLEDESLRLWLVDNGFDVFGIREVDLYWPKVRVALQLQEGLKEWWPMGNVHSVRAHNSTITNKSVLQWGGTAQISMGQAAYRAFESGRDLTNLGRWFWTKYRGKDNRILRIFTGY